jgi:DNA-binding transcriptional regulator YhcF (GntR family)
MPRKSEPKYIAVKTRILRAIASGKVKPGESPGGEADLAKATGLSKFSVIKAFTELVNEGILVRHQGKGTFVTEAAPALVARSFSPAATLKLLHPGPYEDPSAALERFRERMRPANVEFTREVGEADVMIIGGGMNASMAARLLPLNQFIRPEELSAGPALVPEFLVDRYCRHGHLMALPRECSPMVLYYNADRFKEADVPPPDESWTWASLLAAAHALHKPERGWMGIVAPRDLLVIAPFLLQSGARLFDESGTRSQLAAPEAVRALDFYRHLEAASSLRSAGADPNRRTFDAFIEQKAAMMVWGGPLAAQLKRANAAFNWKVEMLPLGPTEKRATVLFSTAVGILKHTRDPARAWELASCLSDRDAQTDLVKLGRLLPADARVEARGPVADVFRRSLPFAAPLMRSDPHEAWYFISDHMKSLWDKAASTEEFCRTIAQDTDKFIEWTLSARAKEATGE